MRDSFPFIDFLVIPTDATTGTRIVIDGVNGTITGYDANDDVTFELNGDDGVQVFDSGGVLVAELGPDGLQVFDNELGDPAATLDTDGLKIYSGGQLVGQFDSMGVRAINPFDGSYAELNPVTNAAAQTPTLVRANADTTNYDTPSGTGTSGDVDLRWLLKTATAANPGSAFTPPATYTERADQLSGGSSMAATLATRDLTATGATGVRTFAVTGGPTWTYGVGVSVVVPQGTSAAAYRSISTATTTVSPVVITKPAGATVGDVLVAFMGVRRADLATASISLPSGWTSLAYVTFGAGEDGTSYRVMYRVVDASEPADYSISFSQPGTLLASFVAVQGASVGGNIPSVAVYDASGNRDFYAASDELEATTTSLDIDVSAFAGSHINVGNSGSGATLAVQAAAVGDNIISIRNGADTQSRLLATGNGNLSWGSGSAAVDNTLSRLNSTTMEFSDSLQVNADLDVAGDIGSLGNIDTVGSINVNDGTEDVNLASGVDLNFAGSSTATLDNQSGRLHHNNFTVPMGMIARFNSTTNSSAYSDGNVTDFSLTFTPITGRLYKFCIHSQADVSVDGANWRLTIRQDGSNIMRLGQWNIDSDAEYIDSCILIPGASLDFGNSNTYDLIANNVAGGGTVTFQANTAIDRQWWVEDVGA